MSPKLRKQRFVFHKLQFRVLQGSVETLFRLYRFVTNLFRITCTKFYKNWLSFVEDNTKTILVCFYGTQLLTCKFPTWWSPYLVRLRSQQFLKGSCDPDPAPLSLISHPLVSTYRVETICEITSVYLYPIQIYAAVPKFKNSASGSNHAPWGGAFGHLWDGTCQDLSVHQIWSPPEAEAFSVNTLILDIFEHVITSI